MPDKPDLNSIYNYFSKVAETNPQYRFQREHHFIVDINIDQPANSNLRNLINTSTSTFNIQIAARDVDFPNITLDMDSEHDLNFISQFGAIMTPGKLSLNSEQNTNLIVNFINTEFSIHENVFLQWTKEVTANQYIYPDYPFSKAKIYVTFYNQNFDTSIYKYVFNECFPYWIEPSKPRDNRGDNINFYRQVKFAFNWMSIEIVKPEYILQTEQIEQQKRDQTAFNSAALNVINKTVKNTTNIANSLLNSISNN